MPETVIAIFVTVFGAMVGSFLNVCIHRMPRGESVVWPSSHCPHCNKRIPAYDNIPFISYIILGAKCRFCRGQISWRYPLVELLTAGMFLVFFIRHGLSYDLLFYLVLVVGLIIATFVDIAHRIIPDEISVGGIIVGFILSAIKGLQFSPLSYHWESLLNSSLGILVGGGIIYGTGKLFDLVYFKLLKRPAIQGETESMGGGDVKLLAMIGAFLGWKLALMSFFIAPMVGLVFALFNVAVKKDHTIPYGPFLALGALISIFWSETILALVIIR